jgi:uncharacterized peroxidase-related enzyme
LKVEEALVQQLAQDYTQASLRAAEKAMLDYAVQLTREPWTMRSASIEGLRTHGWSDGAILDMNLVAAYYAFVNRIADGLGVELEKDWDASSYPPRRAR